MSAIHNSEADFDRMLARRWLGSTWGMAGTAVGIAALAICFADPFFIPSLIAFAGGIGGALRAFRPPEVVRGSLGGMHLLAGLVALLGLVALPVRALVFVLTIG